MEHLSDFTTVEAVVNFDNYDRHGWILGKVLLDIDNMNLEQIRAGLSSHCNRYQGGWIITDRVCLLRCRDEGPTAETWVVRRRLPGPAKEMHEAPEEAVEGH